VRKTKHALRASLVDRRTPFRISVLAALKSAEFLDTDHINRAGKAGEQASRARACIELAAPLIALRNFVAVQRVRSDIFSVGENAHVPTSVVAARITFSRARRCSSQWRVLAGSRRSAVRHCPMDGHLALLQRPRATVRARPISAQGELTGSEELSVVLTTAGVWQSRGGPRRPRA
jgi:hypothetical protein